MTKEAIIYIGVKTIYLINGARKTGYAKKNETRPLIYPGIQYTGHLEDIGSLTYADLSNADTYHYTVSEMTFANITANLRRKVF